MLRGSLRPVLVGLVFDSLASLAVASTLAGFLYGVAPDHPTTHASVVLLLLLVSTAACLGPALGASHVDPQEPLRG